MLILKLCELLFDRIEFLKHVKALLSRMAFDALLNHSGGSCEKFFSLVAFRIFFPV